MPSNNEIIKFNNFHHMIEYRFVIYAGNYIIVEKNSSYNIIPFLKTLKQL
jgi:hypothetical protein